MHPFCPGPLSSPPVSLIAIDPPSVPLISCFEQHSKQPRNAVSVQIYECGRRSPAGYHAVVLSKATETRRDGRHNHRISQLLSCRLLACDGFALHSRGSLCLRQGDCVLASPPSLR